MIHRATASNKYGGELSKADWNHGKGGSILADTRLCKIRYEEPVLAIKSIWESQEPGRTERVTHA